MRKKSLVIKCKPHAIHCNSAQCLFANETEFGSICNLKKKWRSLYKQHKFILTIELPQPNKERKR